MSGTALIETAIGLVLVYLLLSLLCTIVNEWIAQVCKLRSANLKKGIKQMLADPNLEGLAKQLYAHPLIKNSGQQGKNPSYLPASLFARALVDVLDPQAKDAADAAQAVRDLHNAVKGAELPKGVKEPLLTLIDQGVHSLDDVRTSIASWFDDSMDRAAGWYKRSIRYISLGVAAVVTIGVNADTIYIATTLWKEPARRAATAEVAATIAGGCENLDDAACKKKLESVDAIQASLVTLPLGWEGGLKEGWHGGWAILGWLLTTLAVSLGAPFWFETLNKLNAVRAAGPKPLRTKTSGE